MDKLDHIVRATFVFCMVNGAPIQRLPMTLCDDKTKAISPDEQPDKGTLNIANVMDSDHFMH